MPTELAQYPGFAKLLEGLSPVEQQSLVNDLNGFAVESAVVSVIDSLDPKATESLSVFLDSTPGDKEVADFLKAQVPQMGSAVEEALAQLHSDILAVTG